MHGVEEEEENKQASPPEEKERRDENEAKKNEATMDKVQEEGGNEEEEEKGNGGEAKTPPPQQQWCGTGNRANMSAREERRMLLSEAERERSFAFASMRHLPTSAISAAKKGSSSSSSWTAVMGSARARHQSPSAYERGSREARGETWSSISPMGSPRKGWGAKPGSGSGILRTQLLLSHERVAIEEKNESERNAKTKNESESVDKKNEDDRIGKEKSESEKEEKEGETKEKEIRPSSGDARASPVNENLLSELDGAAEQARVLCPQGSDCKSDDPRHFLLYRHTARDEFATPESPLPMHRIPPPPIFNSTSSLSTVSDTSGVHARLRRSVSFDSGLRGSGSMMAPLGVLTRGAPRAGAEMSGWLMKRTQVRKNWMGYWFVLRPHTKQLFYYKSPTDIIAQGKAPEGSFWLEDATVEAIADSDGRASCFRLTIQRKVIFLSASDDESKRAWMQAIEEATKSTQVDSLSSSIKLSNELMRSGILSGFNSIRVEKPSKQDSEKSPQELEAERRKKKRDQKKKERERAYLTNGRKIDWSGRELRELPEKLFDFENFDGLTKLILRSNQLCTFPGEISMLRGLTYLDYSDNMVKELPKEIGGLYRLRELHLDSNRLESLPGEIGKLTRLRVLNVGNGQGWYDVLRVQASANKLRGLPDEIGLLSKLMSLDASNNALSAMPLSLFENCTKLVKLDLSGNQISSIPSSIGRLTRLEKLILSHNKIDCLPPHIGRLRLLKLFHIINNKISRLPPQLGNCTRLEQLYMEQNPIKYPPFQVFKRPLEEMLLYLAELNRGSEQCFRAHVVLLGDDGKNKLMKALTGKSPEKDATRHITTASLTAKLKHGLLPAGAYPTFNIWSVGSELNQPLQQADSLLPSLLLAHEMVAIFTLRYDTADAATLQRWFGVLRAQSPRAAVIVLGYSEQPLPQMQHREILTELRHKCHLQSQGINLVMVDLLNFKSSKDLKSFVATIADVALQNLQSMVRPVLRGVIQIDQLLANSLAENAESLKKSGDAASSMAKAPVLSVNEWLELCELCELNDEEQRTHALALLTSWGSLISVPPDILSKEVQLVHSAPWLISRLVKGGLVPHTVTRENSTSEVRHNYV